MAQDAFNKAWIARRVLSLEAREGGITFNQQISASLHKLMLEPSSAESSYVSEFRMDTPTNQELADASPLQALLEVVYGKSSHISSSDDSSFSP